jgi:hypothetical protein
MSDIRKTNSESQSAIREEWVRPELKKISVEQITAHFAGTKFDGGVGGEKS